MKGAFVEGMRVAGGQTAGSFLKLLKQHLTESERIYIQDRVFILMRYILSFIDHHRFPFILIRKIHIYLI